MKFLSSKSNPPSATPRPRRPRPLCSDSDFLSLPSFACSSLPLSSSLSLVLPLCLLAEKYINIHSHITYDICCSLVVANVKHVLHRDTGVRSSASLVRSVAGGAGGPVEDHRIQLSMGQVPLSDTEVETGAGSSGEFVILLCPIRFSNVSVLFNLEALQDFGILGRTDFWGISPRGAFIPFSFHLE